MLLLGYTICIWWTGGDATEYSILHDSLLASEQMETRVSKMSPFWYASLRPLPILLEDAERCSPQKHVWSLYLLPDAQNRQRSHYSLPAGYLERLVLSSLNVTDEKSAHENMQVMSTISTSEVKAIRYIYRRRRVWNNWKCFLNVVVCLRNNLT